MSGPAQTRLYPTENDRDSRKCFPSALTVNRRGPIRSHSNFTARSIRVDIPNFTIRGIVVHHGIHISRIHGKTETRTTKLSPRVARFPVRLRDNRDSKAVRLKPSSQKRCRERRMIDVTVARNKYHIHLIPASRGNFLYGHRKRCQSRTGIFHIPTTFIKNFFC